MTPDWRGPVIVGRGGYTAVGVTMLSSAAAVRARVSMAQEHPFMVDKLGDPMIVAAVPVLDPHLSGTRRLLSLALPAAAEALAPIAHLTQSPPVTVVVGLPEPRPGLPGQLEIKLREGLDKALSAEVRITAIETAATGHAGGLLAIRRACELLTTGKATFCLAGGVDSWIDPTTLALARFNWPAPLRNHQLGILSRRGSWLLSHLQCERGQEIGFDHVCLCSIHNLNDRAKSYND